MSIIKTISVTAGVLGVVALSCITTYAQDDEFDSDVKPELHLNASDSNNSMLSEAARTGASIVISEDNVKISTRSSASKTHIVQEGDTLWKICEKYFGDPYIWPRIWSYNPKITNPHWIYPGEALWLVPPSGAVAAATADNSSQVVPRASKATNNAVFIRNRGYVDKETLKQAGIIRGAQKETILLAQHDEAYVEFNSDQDIKVGDEFAAFEVIRSVGNHDDPESELGKLVEILGSVRVINWDKEQGIALIVIDECVKPINRGTKIGFVHQKFHMVPANPNQQEIKGNIVAFLDMGVLAAAHEIVFVDKGHKQGVKEGNSFFAIQKRDRLRQIDNKKDDHDGYPFEILAEMRVIEARPNTSTCLITAAVKELEIGAEVEMVKGY